MSTDIATAALRLAQLGHPVIPLHHVQRDGLCSCADSDCRSPGKHPRTPNGLKEASVEPVVVVRWWRRWKLANLGLLTGERADLLVVDLDGPSGIQTWSELRSQHGEVPRTRWVRTGGGGWHIYFRHPGGKLGNSCRKLGPGIDTRGDNGYVLAPPSGHVSGDVYEWANAERAAPCPEWLINLLRPPAPLARQVHQPVVGQGYAEAALRHEVEGVVGAVVGSRNHTLNRSAFSLGTLVGAGRIDEGRVLEALLDAAIVAGLGQKEAEATIRSGLRAGVRHPRTIVA